MEAQLDLLPEVFTVLTLTDFKPVPVAVKVLLVVWPTSSKVLEPSAKSSVKVWSNSYPPIYLYFVVVVVPPESVISSVGSFQDTST